MNDGFLERLPLTSVHPIMSYGVTFMLCTTAFLVRLAADPILGMGYPYVMFFPAIIVAAFLFGARVATSAAILCGILSWYFFIPPRGSFAFDAAIAVALAFYLFVVVTVITLIHWMQRANRRLAQEREKGRAMANHMELLFRELQHRVSNNLQVAAALLSLQRRVIEDPDARKALDEASGRLALIGKISRALYDPSGQRMTVRSFVETLAADILEANGRNDIHVDLAIDGEIMMDADAAVPFALVMAESISNALEHGFGGRAGGTIRVTVNAENGMTLEVADDGSGLPQGFRLEDSKSLGLRIASTLAQQMGGSFRLIPGDSGGVRALLAVPA